jgi:uncharacterized protein YjbJ (UPF0337 family)
MSPEITTRSQTTMSQRIPGTAAGGLIDKAVGKAKQAAGAVLGNDDLRREGVLHEQKAAAAKQATELTAEAEREQQRADLTGRQRETEVERQRLLTEAATDRRQQQIEQSEATAKASVEAQTVRKEVAVEQQAAAQEAAIDRAETQAVRERLAAEQDATALDAQAEADRRTADVLDPDRKDS